MRLSTYANISQQWIQSKNRKWDGACMDLGREWMKHDTIKIYINKLWQNRQVYWSDF